MGPNKLSCQILLATSFEVSNIEIAWKYFPTNLVVTSGYFKVFKFNLHRKVLKCIYIYLNYVKPIMIIKGRVA